MAAYEETRAANALEAESQSQNGSNDDNGNGRDGNGGYGNGGDENGGNGNGGNGNPNENDRGARPFARECTYQDFMKCQGNEKSCQMEYELWNLIVKNNDLVAYTQRFQELTMMYTKMVPEEEDRVEKFIGGLPEWDLKDFNDSYYYSVIKNRNKVLRRTVGTVEPEYEPTTTEEKQDIRNEMKARATLLMALPNKDQLKFHSYQDAKLLMEAIEKRLQKLISQLEIQGEVISQEDMNLKLLSSLPSEWKTHALIWRNKNVAFVSNSTNNTNNSNKADITAHGVSTTHTQGNGVNSTSLDNLCDVVICAFLASQPNSPQLSQEDLEQHHSDDLEEMDLQWEMAMLTIRARRFIKRTGRKLDINGQRVGFDNSKVEYYNCHKHRYFARECRFPRNQENKGRENNSRTVLIESPTQNALIAQDGIRGYDWSYQVEEEQPTNHALMAFTSSGSSFGSDSEVDSCSKTCVKAYATLKEQYDSLSSDYKKSQFNLLSYKAGLQSVEARLAHYKKNETVFEESINVLKLEVRLRDNALNEYKMNLEKAEKERDKLKQTLEKFQNSSKSLNDLLESQSGSDKGYQSVPPPLSGNFIPRKLDLTFIDEFFKSETLDVNTVVTPYNAKIVENKGVSNTVESNTIRMNNTSALIIEDRNSNDESKIDYTVRPSTEKIKSIKTVKETDAPK
ncbi:hypothetical protein Tco_0648625 [Tanacetum coccineum]